MDFEVVDELAVSLPKPDLHVRISERAMRELDALAVALSKDRGVVAGELLTKALLGEGHAMRLAAQRYLKAGIVGSVGEEP